MKKHFRYFGIIFAFFCVLLLPSCNSVRSGVDTPGPDTPGPDTPGPDTPSPDVLNYLSDPKFDTTEALPQYDSDPTWTTWLNSSVCATEDTLYFSDAYNNQIFLQYIDLSTGFSDPLCGKPECPHNSSECNAFADAQGLSIYDGKLYWEGFTSSNGPTIYRMELDGTDRATVCSYDTSLSQRGGNTRAFHRGYLIRGGQQYTVSGGSPSSGALAYAVDLSTGETTIILDEIREGFAGNLLPIPYRDKVYLLAEFWIPGEDVEEYTLEIHEWSLKTHELRLLYSQTVDMFCRGAWATEEGILFSSSMTGEIFKFDFSDNELSLRFDMNSDGGNHDMADFAGGYLVDWGLTEERIPHIHVTDLEGNVVYSEDLDLPDWPTRGWTYSLLGADHGNLYVTLRMTKKEGRKEFLTDMIARIPLNGGGTVETLWSYDLELG